MLINGYEIENCPRCGSDNIQMVEMKCWNQHGKTDQTSWILRCLNRRPFAWKCEYVIEIDLDDLVESIRDWNKESKEDNE